MTQEEEEGNEVDVHTPDKALPENKMKDIVLNSLQKKTQAKSNVLEIPLTVAVHMHNQIDIMHTSCTACIEGPPQRDEAFFFHFP